MSESANAWVASRRSSSPEYENWLERSPIRTLPIHRPPHGVLSCTTTNWPAAPVISDTWPPEVCQSSHGSGSRVKVSPPELTCSLSGVSAVVVVRSVVVVSCSVVVVSRSVVVVVSPVALSSSSPESSRNPPTPSSTTIRTASPITRGCRRSPGGAPGGGGGTPGPPGPGGPGGGGGWCSPPGGGGGTGPGAAGGCSPRAGAPAPGATGCWSPLAGGGGTGGGVPGPPAGAVRSVHAVPSHQRRSGPPSGSGYQPGCTAER